MNTDNNDSSEQWIKSRQAWDLADESRAQELLSFPLASFARYEALLKEWNPSASLMSRNELFTGIDEHVADSLSLIPFVPGTPEPRWLDIGSGGGFPLIPLSLALPGVRFVAIERKFRKVSFLSKVIRELALANVDVLHGRFPDVVESERFDIVTARAVEQPQVVHANIAPFVSAGARFLAQGPRPSSFEGTEFSIEEVVDQFCDRELRRGALWTVTA